MNDRYFGTLGQASWKSARAQKQTAANKKKTTITTNNTKKIVAVKRNNNGYNTYVHNGCLKLITTKKKNNNNVKESLVVAIMGLHAEARILFIFSHLILLFCSFLLKEKTVSALNDI